MKVITLMQPWASALFYIDPKTGKPIKTWETRSWRPGPTTKYLIDDEGLLIHTSAKMDTAPQLAAIKWLRDNNYHAFLDEGLPYSAIIGHVKLGNVITTDAYAKHVHTIGDRSNYALGDYSANRYAWEILSPFEFDQTDRLYCKGQLNFWNSYHYSFNQKSGLVELVKLFV